MSAAGHGRYILYSPEGCGKSSTDHVKHELCCVLGVLEAAARQTSAFTTIPNLFAYFLVCHHYIIVVLLM